MSHSTFLPSTFTGLPSLESAASPPEARGEAAARWPWVAIAGCVLMFALMALNHAGQARMARASQALHTTWLPAVDQLAELQLAVRDLSGEAAQRSAWTPGQLRGRISDDLAQLSHKLTPAHLAPDAHTPELVRALQQRWAAYTAMSEVDGPERAAHLLEVAEALALLNGHCLAQSQAQADVAAGR